MMYLQRLIVVILFVTGICFAIGKGFDALYKKKLQFLFQGDLEEILSGKENYDILFFGNSKIHSGINPYYIDSVTKYQAYNLGLGAADAAEIKLLSTVYLQNHIAPKIMVLGIDNSMLSSYSILKERFFYLFYLQNDTIKKYMSENGFPQKLIKILPFTKYSFFDEYNRASIFNNKNGIESNYKGFVLTSLSKVATSDTQVQITKDKPFYRLLPGDGRVNDTAANFITGIVKMFFAKGTKVIFLKLPLKTIAKNTFVTPADSFYLNLSNQYSIPIIRADTTSLFPDKYFIDNFHLNEQGSKILSLFVADYLNKSIRKSTTP